jgi:hypothetical protein
LKSAEFGDPILECTSRSKLMQTFTRKELTAATKCGRLFLGAAGLDLFVQTTVLNLEWIMCSCFVHEADSLTP